MQLDEAMGLQPVADSGLFREFSGLAEQWRQGLRPALPAVKVVWHGRRWHSEAVCSPSADGTIRSTQCRRIRCVVWR